MARKFDYDRAATALAEADFTPDAKVCERWGVTLKTLWRWRKKELTDEKLQSKVRLRRNLIQGTWKEESVKYLKKWLSHMDAQISKSENIPDFAQIIEAYKVVSECRLGEVILSDDESDQDDPEVSETTGSTGSET